MWEWLQGINKHLASGCMSALEKHYRAIKAKQNVSKRIWTMRKCLIFRVTACLSSQIKSKQGANMFPEGRQGPSRGRPTTSPLLLTLPISITSLLHWSTSLVMQSEGPRSFPRVSLSYFHLTCRVIYPTCSFQCELLTLKIPNMEIILKKSALTCQCHCAEEEKKRALQSCCGRK